MIQIDYTVMHNLRGRTHCKCGKKLIRKRFSLHCGDFVNDPAKHTNIALSITWDCSVSSHNHSSFDAASFCLQSGNM